MRGATTAERRRRTVPRHGRPAPTAGRPARRGVLVLLILATLMAAGGTWLLYGSPWVRTQRVRVSGITALTAEQVRDAAAVPVGGPLASVNTEVIEHRLLSGLPRIAEVDVTRSWPHTIDLKVTERTPAIVLENGGKFIEVDAGGVRFATVDTAPKGVPLVELTSDQSPSFRHFGTKRLLQSAVQVVADLPDSVRKDARLIRVRSYDGITVELSGGRTVVWGSAEHGAEKSAVLIALMKAAGKAVRFDVSAPSAPAASGS